MQNHEQRIQRLENQVQALVYTLDRLIGYLQQLHQGDLPSAETLLRERSTLQHLKTRH